MVVVSGQPIDAWDKAFIVNISHHRYATGTTGMPAIQTLFNPTFIHPDQLRFVQLCQSFLKGLTFYVIAFGIAGCLFLRVIL